MPDIKCPNCERVYRSVPMGRIGKKVECNSCGDEFTALVHVEKDTAPDVQCPNCGFIHRFLPCSQIGKTVKCKSCGEGFTAFLPKKEPTDENSYAKALLVVGTLMLVFSSVAALVLLVKKQWIACVSVLFGGGVGGLVLLGFAETIRLLYEMRRK